MLSARRQSPLEIQFRVVVALMIREMMTRYGRTAGGYVWAIIEPLATIALLSLVFQQIARHPALGTNFPFFFASGYLAFHIYMDVSRSVSSAVNSNRPLLNFPRITMIDLILARFLLQLATSVLAFAVVMSGIMLFFEISAQIHLGTIFLGIFFAAFLGLGVGALNCVLFAFSPTWERLFGILNRPMMLISGVFFNYESVSSDLQSLLWWNPLIHVTATMRQGFFAEYHAAFVSPLFVSFVALGTLMLGILLLRVLRARVLEIID